MARTLLQQRLCTLYNQCNIEDEINFVVGCSYYQLQREQLFSFIVKNVSVSFKELSQEDKFIFSLKLRSEYVKRFAKYIVSIWESRTHFYANE